MAGRLFRGNRWKDAFGVSFIFFSWTYATYIVTCFLMPHYFADEGLGDAIFYGYLLLAFLTLISLLQAVRSDAGRVYAVSQSTADSLGWNFCEKCEKVKPPRSHHCSKCGRCSRKMDHHCIWINNCVGEDNNGIFFRFLCFALLQSTVSVFMLLYYYMEWFPPCKECVPVLDKDAIRIRIQMLILSVIVLWLFGFTSGLVVDRALLIAGDVTTIELLKDRTLLRARLNDPANPGTLRNLAHTFGTPHYLLWFIPCCCEGRVTPEYERTQQTLWVYDV